MTVQVIECSTDEMAEVLGILPRTLQKLQRDGWIEGKVAHGRWDLGKTTRSYLTHVQLEALTKRR
jgi:hypothetical protein